MVSKQIEGILGSKDPLNRLWICDRIGLKIVMDTRVSDQLESQDLEKTNGDVLIRAEGVSKKFCRSFKRSLWYGVQDVVSELNPFSRSSAGGSSEELRQEEFWAVSDVTFELRRGECLGLIGHNGAGKTTLLRMLNGLIKPDRGRIEIRGRVGAIIALGAGFNPLLSGRENVYVYGSVLGLTKHDIDRQIDDIIDFAELEDFIDAPVQSYSSGMQVRLGFAVATAMRPDVLLLDEVLAVGDMSFRHKCFNRINKIIKQCAVIFVSHSVTSVSTVSSSVGFMDHGVFRLFPEVVEGIGAYNNAMNQRVLASGISGDSVFATYPPIESAKVDIVTPQVEYGESLVVRIDLCLTGSIDDIELSFNAVDTNEITVLNWTLSRQSKVVNLEAGRSVFQFTIPELHLHAGVYRWGLRLGKKGSIEANLFASKAGAFTVTSKFKPCFGIPYVVPPIQFKIERF